MEDGESQERGTESRQSDAVSSSNPHVATHLALSDVFVVPSV